MRRTLKLLLSLAAASALVLCLAAPAAAAPDLGGFTISDYTVNAVVSQDNVYDITEIIKVNFTEDRHGIYRDIPINQKFIRTSGDSIVKSSVSDISVEDRKFAVSRTTDDFGQPVVELKIGDADQYVSGLQTYQIHYKLKFGNDGENAYDEVYYNIIGNAWNTTIDHMSFSVTLPSDFDAKKLGFDIGGYGSSGYDPSDLTFQVSGNTISGSMQRALVPNEAVTMRMELPQGYFNVPDLRLPDWIMMGFITALGLVALLLFLVYGRDEKPVQTVEFNAPDGLTPSEIGYINDGVVDTRDVVSLILYWADKGYLAIEEQAGVFTLMKKHDLSTGSMKPFEQHMFNQLFKSGDTVTTNDLKYTFYTTINTTKSMVADSFQRERRVFTKISSALKPLLSFMAALPMMLTLFMTFSRNGYGFTETCIYTGISGVLVLLPVFFLIGTLRKWRSYKPAARVTALIFELLFIFLAICIFVAITAEKVYEPLLPWWAVIMTVVIALAAVFIVKRTPQGVEWLGKINGFRDFIVLAERDKLIAMVQQDPSYFYHVLPYAYVLNVTDKWARNFEAIALEPPQWYYGYNHSTFNSLLFMGAINNSMNSFRSSMTSVPSNNGSGGGFGGGGGFSGGGFSGGGGGGGGGGSW